MFNIDKFSTNYAILLSSLFWRANSKGEFLDSVNACRAFVIAEYPALKNILHAEKNEVALKKLYKYLYDQFARPVHGNDIIAKLSIKVKSIYIELIYKELAETVPDGNTRAYKVAAKAFFGLALSDKDNCYYNYNALHEEALLPLRWADNLDEDEKAKLADALKAIREEQGFEWLRIATPLQFASMLDHLHSDLIFELNKKDQSK